MNFAKRAEELSDQIIKDRRYLHQHPELSYKEKNTTAYLVASLKELGIPVQTFEDYTGCIATIKGGKPGKHTVLLRGDIDALPIKENSGVEFESENEGVMHACGHDCHTSMLLGAAKILSAHRDEIHGTVKLIFQMAEEIGRKSEEYVKRGALEGVDAIFGMHIWSAVPAGKVNFESGERMACSDRFTIKIHGKSSHGSAPHEGKDAIIAGAAAIQALQTIPSRINNPFNALVVTVGIFNGGTKENIIADQAELTGTVRAFNREFRNSMPEVIKSVVEPVVKGYGCSAEVDYYFGPSPLINDHEDLVQIARGAASKEMGEDALIPLKKMTGAEDFSVYMETVPGVFGYLGCRNEEKGIIAAHHHPAFDVDEDVLYHGTGIYVQFALDYLNA